MQKKKGLLLLYYTVASHTSCSYALHTKKWYKFDLNIKLYFHRNICILILNLVLIVIPVGVLSKIKGDDIKLKSLNVHENLLINICELKLCGIAEEKVSKQTINAKPCVLHLKKIRNFSFEYEFLLI